MGFVDFEKAFDSIEHEGLWHVLADQGVEVDYIELLKLLYKDQTASVLAGAKSRSFHVGRGVKQGDPISALLFIAVMEAIFRKLKTKWHSLNKRRENKYFGIVVDDPEDPLTNLRFADDVMMIAGSRSDIGKMIKDLKAEAKHFGLTLHAGKTKVLTNSVVKKHFSIDCDGQAVEVLSGDSAERYLGRKFAVCPYHDTELAHQIDTGWK